MNNTHNAPINTPSAISFAASTMLILGLVVAPPKPAQAASAATPTALPTLTAAQTQAIVADKTQAYALLARPIASTTQAVDLVTLDPTTLQPTARGPFPNAVCARLHAARNGSIICSSNPVYTQPISVQAPKAITRWYAPNLATNRILSPENQQGQRVSRARISPDAQYAAWTNFADGDSYQASPGSSFSTDTWISALQANPKKTPLLKTGANTTTTTATSPAPDSTVFNLNTWVLSYKQKTVSAPDLNYWGVSFDPNNSQHFVVTASFGGKQYLAQGDVMSKQLTVLLEGVECPSFSPDGKRIAFKKRISPIRWAPAVLDVKTLQTTVFDYLDYSVDDQIDWLDAQTLLYEVLEVRLLGPAATHLHTLSIANPNAKTPSAIWLENARSAAIYNPKNASKAVTTIKAVTPVKHR